MPNPKCMLEGWTGAVVTLVPKHAWGSGQETEMKLSFYAGGEFVFWQVWSIWSQWAEQKITAKEVISQMDEIKAEIERFDAKPVGPCQIYQCVDNADGTCEKHGIIREIVERCKWNISIESSDS